MTAATETRINYGDLGDVLSMITKEKIEVISRQSLERFAEEGEVKPGTKLLLVDAYEATNNLLRKVVKRAGQIPVLATTSLFDNKHDLSPEGRERIVRQTGIVGLMDRFDLTNNPFIIQNFLPTQK